MAIFKKKLKPLIIDYSQPTSIESSTQYGNLESQLFQLKAEKNEKVVPENTDATLLLTGGVQENNYKTDPSIDTFLEQDIAQSHHFKITIDKIPVEFTTIAFENFLPVKSINFDEITFEHLTIPVGIFGDFPVLQRRKMGRMSLILYDTADDEIEHAIQAWENECFPQGKYVNYLSQMVGNLKYASYSVEGKLNRELSLFVLPADSHRVSRSYEENAAKLISIGLVIVGVEGGQTATVVSPKAVVSNSTGTPSVDRGLLSGDDTTPLTRQQQFNGTPSSQG